jgi:exopolyphosphatase
MQPEHVVLGNEAGDADSLISAIALAYIESVKGQVPKTPLLPIPLTDLQTQRPETVHLLHLAGINSAQDLFWSADYPALFEENRNVTLVDHNRLGPVFQASGWKVVEILDHHVDLGQHLDTCSGHARKIAFQGNQALVASTCTLIVERLQELWEPPFPADLSLLLLGVILLDSVNMSPAAGKGTTRDAAAIDKLQQETSWNDLSKETKKALGTSKAVREKPDTLALFEALQNAKFEGAFWESLSVRDAVSHVARAMWYLQRIHPSQKRTSFPPFHPSQKRTSFPPSHTVAT